MKHNTDIIDIIKLHCEMSVFFFLRKKVDICHKYRSFQRIFISITGLPMEGERWSQCYGLPKL